MTKKTRNWLIVLLSIPAAVILAAVGLLIFDAAQPLPPIQPLPNPNGYDDFVQAGEIVKAGAKADFTELKNLSREELLVLVSKNAKALQIARTGLQQESRVPLDYSPTSRARFDKLPSIKYLAFAFMTEGKLAEVENRFNDASKSYLDLVRLANQSGRGGTLIDEMVSIAFEAMVTENLQKLPGRLDAKSCRETAATLETLDAQRQSWNEVMRQEDAWSRRTFPELRYRLSALMAANSQKKIERHVEQRYKEQEIKTRQLLIDLAARAYELDKGHRPANLADLVPDYLKAIPQDPVTGTNLTYSPR